MYGLFFVQLSFFVYRLLINCNGGAEGGSVVDGRNEIEISYV